MSNIVENTLKMLNREEASIKASNKLNSDRDKALENAALNYMILNFESRIASWKFAALLLLLFFLLSMGGNVVALLKILG